nr:hypothetical protein [Oscillospiraceae bacterium]MBQ8243599.1 hypothetical protein [Oscillospiraceae bacterium]
MYFPQLNRLKQKAVSITKFAGIDRSGRPADGAFYDMQNLTSDGYPVLQPRNGRQVYAQTPCGGMLAKDALCYVNDESLVINGYAIDLGLTEGEKQLVSMGAYVVIFPDKKYINTLDYSDKGSLEAFFTSTASVAFSLCQADGGELAKTSSPDAPEDPADGAYWLDENTGELKQYSAPSESWVSVVSTYVKLETPGIGKDFSVGDEVTLSGIAAEALQDLNTTAVIMAKGNNFLVIPGMVTSATTQDIDQGAVKVERTVPEMDFVIESDNRLWGCRYGFDRAGKIVNELYACKLGDFKNWQVFQGLSTDSYRVSLGADGVFTGAFTYLGQPIFFRENCLHKVYGSYPAEYRLQTTACRGVQQGSHKSLALVDEVLYYKASDGICAYDGSLPVCISQKLGSARYHAAAAGSYGSKYYISMADKNGEYHLFVYDTARRLWHREDNLAVAHFCTRGDALYGADGERIWVLAGAEDSTEQIHWMAKFGPLSAEDPYKRYISRIVPRLLLEPGTRVRFLVRYDGKGGWQTLGTVTGSGLRSFSLPMRTRRCDFLELRMEGVGQGKIHSLTLVQEKGSELL